MNILFLTPYPLHEAPSQRFRFEQYFGVLKQEGHSFEVQSFLDPHNWRRFYKPGKRFLKGLYLLRGFCRRLLVLTSLSNFDFVFIHREASPIGPPVFEWLIGRIFRKKIIYDFDDAIWLTDKVTESVFVKTFKWRHKIKNICRWSYKVSCGNQYLCDYARSYNANVLYNPTTIDIESLHNPAALSGSNPDGIVIGWTGSHSTLKYLAVLESTLKDLEREFPFVKFMVIADQKPALNLKSMVFKPWCIETEIEDLRQFDIGIMPLPDDEWCKGKCAFKALQYMALEIPAIASPVGSNNSVITHGMNGLLASTDEDWKESIRLLIENKMLRSELGKRGRETVVNHFSVRSNKANFLSLFA